MKGLTDIRVLFNEVRRLAHSNPSFIYQHQTGTDGSCSYLGSSVELPERGQGCIIGQALTNTHLATREELAKHEGSNARATILAVLSKKHGITYKDEDYTELFDLCNWFRAVQFAQDHSKRWDTAIERADKSNAELLDTLSATD